MKILTRHLLLISLLGFLITSACGNASPKTTPLTGDEAGQVQALADPLADNILTSVVNNDFSAYTKNFDDVMLKLNTRDNFNNMVSGLNKQFGAYQFK